jgi:hypothetical protein
MEGIGELLLVEFSNPDGELEPELIAIQSEPRSIEQILDLCRSYRVHARLRTPTGVTRFHIDPEGRFLPP